MARDSKAALPQILPDDDGYTATAFIKGREGLFGDTRVTFRPVLLEDWAEFQERIPKTGSVDRIRHQAAGLVDRIVDWNCTDSEGKRVPITVANVLRVQKELFFRLLDIVLYSADGGDIESGEAKAVTKETEPLDDPFGRKAKSVSAAVAEQQKN